MKPFQFRHSKICKEAKFLFMISPITFVTYLKLTLIQFHKIHPMINFWLKQLSMLLLVFPEKRNVNKHKKNVISFIDDIVSYCCIVELLQVLFRKKALHDKVLGSIVFQAFSYYSNKWFDFFHSNICK